MLVSKEFVFDAAHDLPDYPGKCRKLHGHTYRLQVTVEAPIHPKTGIACDFQDISNAVRKQVIEVLDHTYLNETIETSTAENVVLWMWRRIQPALDARLVELTLWETPTSWVTYRGE
jgi:6-pyruvoyltetrahydropterin/6-carboxytetrahydropterin synthase